LVLDAATTAVGNYGFSRGVVVMRDQKFQPGDPVIFSMSKVSTEPGPRAVDIHPAPSGETYNYLVPKFWRVEQRHADDTVTLVTRRGKRHNVAVDDPRLRRANLWERWFYASRFPTASEPTAPSNQNPSHRVLAESATH
jgi:hypothetical protein